MVTEIINKAVWDTGQGLINCSTESVVYELMSLALLAFLLIFMVVTVPFCLWHISFWRGTSGIYSKDQVSSWAQKKLLLYAIGNGLKRRVICTINTALLPCMNTIGEKIWCVALIYNGRKEYTSNNQILVWDLCLLCWDEDMLSAVLHVAFLKILNYDKNDSPKAHHITVLTSYIFKAVNQANNYNCWCNLLFVFIEP